MTCAYILSSVIESISNFRSPEFIDDPTWKTKNQPLSFNSETINRALGNGQINPTDLDFGKIPHHTSFSPGQFVWYSRKTWVNERVFGQMQRLTSLKFNVYQCVRKTKDHDPCLDRMSSSVYQRIPICSQSVNSCKVRSHTFVAIFHQHFVCSVLLNA